MRHKIFGLRDLRTIKELQENHLDHGLKMMDSKQKMKCLCCTKVKIVQNTYPKSSEQRASKVGYLFHANNCGHFQNVTPASKRYFLTLKDDKSRSVTVYLLKQKSEAETNFEEF